MIQIWNHVITPVYFATYFEIQTGIQSTYFQFTIFRLKDMLHILLSNDHKMP